MVYAVHGGSFAVAPGETLGIVGESRSGKSVTVLSVLGPVRGAGTVHKSSRATSAVRAAGKEIAMDIDLQAEVWRTLCE